MKIKILRKLAFYEGISYLLLFAVTMPLKYIMNMPQPNLIIGSLHGLLFILYCLYAFLVYKEIKGWNLKILLIVLIASILPFGTFILDSKLLKKYDKSI